MTLPQAVADTTQAAPNPETAYDSVWAHLDLPVQASSGIEQVMLSQDKLYVVLAVVLIIWCGLVFFLFRTDRKLDRLERTMDERIPERRD